jgi:hypothetical protein
VELSKAVGAKVSTEKELFCKDIWGKSLPDLGRTYEFILKSAPWQGALLEIWS